MRKTCDRIEANMSDAGQTDEAFELTGLEEANGRGFCTDGVKGRRETGTEENV